MRVINAIHKAEYEPIGDLITYRAMPTASAPINRLDPFIFLNHHGYQEYLPHNSGLPFGPHPHRGFQTVTFILGGDLTHKDNSGENSIIKQGGIQWMTAGSGLVHAEISSEEFKAKGGPLEILQLWVNLAAKDKMTTPEYTGLQKDQIPDLELDNKKVIAHLVSGGWGGIIGPVEPLSDIHLCWMDFKESGAVQFTIAADKNILLYVVKGEVLVNDKEVFFHHLVEFGHEGENISITATVDATILFGYATPFNEPFIAYGPFVMNTREEIMASYEDYNNGKFGSDEGLAD